jgi:hypothetical protein
MECENSSNRLSSYIAYIAGISLLLSIFLAVTTDGQSDKILVTALLIIGMIGLPISMFIHDCQK